MAMSMPEVLGAFSAAVAKQDVNAIMAVMTDDCVFENSGPAPDGERAEGQAAVRAVWERLFRTTPTGKFEHEEVFVTGDRAVTRWKATWDGGHVRGVDVFRVRDGKIAEKLSYMKGALPE
jgi:ketosteroid isomerase-like protein